MQRPRATGVSESARPFHRHTVYTIMQQVIAKPPGLKPFEFFIHDGADRFISDRIRQTGRWEPFESALLLKLLRQGDQMIDVGANIGWYTVSSALKVGSTGHVFAFEPDAKNFDLLSANITAARVQCVSAERAALGRGSGTAVIRHSLDNQGDHRIRSFVPDETVGPDPARGIPVIALDAYLSGHPHLRLNRLRIIKIDVQGFENEVLLGARQLLAGLPDRTILFIEFDPALLREQDPTALLALIDALESLGRNILEISRPLWRLKKVRPEELRSAAKGAGGRSLDLVVVHAESIADVYGALPGVPRFLSWAGRSM